MRLKIFSNYSPNFNLPKRPKQKIVANRIRLGILNLEISPKKDKYKKIRKWIPLSVKKLKAAMFGIDCAGTILSQNITPTDIKKTDL